MKRAAVRTVRRRARIAKVPPSCKVYTPPSLAQAMAATLGHRDGDVWLEPSVGTGALLSALRAENVPREMITGIDLDPQRQDLDALAMVKRGVEFLAWAQSTRKRFDKIICNPPYVAIERLQKSVRTAACRIQTLDGVCVSAASNLWYAFLCAAINLLRENGSLCFVLPAAWDFANYVRPLKDRIAGAFERVEVYRCAKPLFHASEIQDGAVVLVARCKLSHAAALALPESHSIWRKDFPRGSELFRALRTARQTRSAISNGTATSKPLMEFAIGSRQKTVLFGDAVSIHLGGVTGDTGYFLLTEVERRKLNLPIAALRPVVSRARHLQAAWITKKYWLALMESGERVWLFDPSPATLSHPAVRAYRLFGQRGGCNLDSHKISHRDPWYRTPLPNRVDGFISGMSQFGPWLSFRDTPRLSATNTLYVVAFKSDDDNYRAALALALLSSETRKQLPALGRRYADGLLKFEPGDLREIRLTLPQQLGPATHAYRRAITAMLAGDMNLATAIADAYSGATCSEANASAA